MCPVFILKAITTFAKQICLSFHQYRSIGVFCDALGALLFATVMTGGRFNTTSSYFGGKSWQAGMRIFLNEYSSTWRISKNTNLWAPATDVIAAVAESKVSTPMKMRTNRTAAVLRRGIVAYLHKKWQAKVQKIVRWNLIVGKISHTQSMLHLLLFH